MNKGGASSGMARPVTAQPDSNANGSGHPTRHGAELRAAGHCQCRTIKDRPGSVKGAGSTGHAPGEHG
jgi:hypothetical protein